MTTATIKLEPRLGLAQAVPLAELLRENAEADLQLDVSDVTHLGALCAQLIIAAKRQHRENGARFQIVGDTQTFEELLKVLGLSIEILMSIETGSELLGADS